MHPDDPILRTLRSVATVSERDGPETSMEALRERGWRYQDFPKMEPEHWAYFKAAFGQEGVDYHILSEATYPSGAQRGQMMLSPKAFENLRAYKDTHPLPGTPLAS